MLCELQKVEHKYLPLRPGRSDHRLLILEANRRIISLETRLKCVKCCGRGIGAATLGVGNLKSALILPVSPRLGTQRGSS